VIDDPSQGDLRRRHTFGNQGAQPIHRLQTHVECLAVGLKWKRRVDPQVCFGLLTERGAGFSAARALV
jgi:hypothetical protein